MEYITSRSNPLIAHIRRLSSSRSRRREAGEYLGEGVKLLKEALLWDAAPHTVVFSPGTPLPELPGGIRAVEVPEDVLRTVSTLDTPQGVLFLGRAPDTSPPERLSGDRYLALEGVQDPGNVGTILRTADAFDADGLFLLEGCADPFGPKALRSSMGAAFRRPVWECGLDTLAGLLAGAGIPLMGTALRPDAVDIGAVDLGRSAVLLGSEGRGLSERALSACARAVKIPMSERCESLNVASAAAIVLWEGVKARKDILNVK